MIDTLRLARRLSQAGMDPTQADALAEALGEELKDAAVTRRDLESSQNALFWRVVAAVALMLLAHLAAVWSIVGSAVQGS